jgi:hypothetical protein
MDLQHASMQESASHEESSMRSMWTIALIALLQSVGSFPATAGSPCADVGPPRKAICVCNKSYCWIEPGTIDRFDARFAGAKALTSTGVIGVWRPIRVKPSR